MKFYERVEKGENENSLISALIISRNNCSGSKNYVLWLNSETRIYST